MSANEQAKPGEPLVVMESPRSKTRCANARFDHFLDVVKQRQKQKHYTPMDEVSPENTP